MAVHYTNGELKTRPGVYQRQENAGNNTATSSRDGICAIPIQSTWGPLGKVLRNGGKADLTQNYGSGDYGTGYTVPAAAAMFDGGASTVYTYRLGTGGTKATCEITEGLTATAKYPGTMPISLAVRAKVGDSTMKQLLVYVGTTLKETFDFAADASTEGTNLIAASAGSAYIDVTGEAVTVPTLAVASGALSGGTNPTVTNSDYSAAFAAMERYYYNTISLDVDDDEDMTLSLLLLAYLDNAHKMGKLGIAVVGQKTTVDFETRCAKAKAFNNAMGVYLGGGCYFGSVKKDGVLAICQTAGAIAYTPSNQSIVHSVVKGATDLCEDLTYFQYEQAIQNGMLLFSRSPDGSIWYDSGITTLTVPDSETQDDGWKKIRRTKVRFELFDRLDRALSPKVGNVSADTDGIADVVQTGQRVLDQMANNEGKLMSGASFTEDPDNPYSGDSAWFIIQAVDVDSLEKIYLRYMFRYSQNS